MGERYFIRCVLPVSIIGTDQEFGWGAWSEVEWPVFERYLELYEEDATAEPLQSGKLANTLPAYPNSVGTPVEIQFRDSSKRPTLHLLEGDQSLLAREQRAGIDGARYHQILELIDAI
jgi:hypothetical protein